MNKERKKEFIKDRLKRFALPFGMFFLNMLIILMIFFLYGLTLEPFFYGFAVTLIVMLIFFAADLAVEWGKAQIRERKLAAILSEWNDLPAPESLTDKDYAAMIEQLGRQMNVLASNYADERRQTQDFYTTWVHQVKTPIAVMKLALGGAGEADKRALQEELFRIEQYTDMILAYQRLGSETNDLRIEEYPLDELIRGTIRKFASQFIYKKIKLEYEGCDVTIVTDRKWFGCILEQFISNALKYTQKGTISISVKDGKLYVADTGIGIAAEDLPRIFEKGYTGMNGRQSDRSSGLGLYLCGKAAALLNLSVDVESTVGKGSSFSVSLAGERK